MSQTCGDTARAHRQRKQRIRHREMVRKLRAQLTGKPTATSETTPKK
jgi:hypothetical protein